LGCVRGGVEVGVQKRRLSSYDGIRDDGCKSISVQLPLFVLIVYSSTPLLLYSSTPLLLYSTSNRQWW
jgi:hypothetical protein